MRKPVTLLLACLATVAASQPVVTPPGFSPLVGVLPTYNDSNWNWQNAGLQKIGGIPNRATQCGSTVSPSGLIPPQANDDAALIQAALNACTAGQVVQLASGTFNLDMTENLFVGTGISLRGNGACSNASTPYCNTVIQVYNGLLAWTGAKCGVDISHEVTCDDVPIIVMQPAAAHGVFDLGWAGQNGHCGLLSSAIGCGTTLDADASKGQLTVRVHSTTGFSVGQWVLIDEASGATWVNDPVGPNLYGQVWAAPDFTSTSATPVTGRVQWLKYANGTGDMGSGDYPYNNPNVIETLFDRATSELHLITAIGAGPCPGTSCTVTFDDPLTIAYRVSGATTFTGAISNGSGGAGTTLATTGDSCITTVAQIIDDSSHAIADGTYVTAVNSCSGGVGNYTVSISQNVSSRTMIGGAHQAHLYYSTNQDGLTAIPFLEQAGIENMTLSRATGGSITMQFCAYCWVKNVESINWASGSVNFYWSARNQVDTVYSNHCGNSNPNGAEYPFGFNGGSTENYLVNSIARMCGKGMVGKGSAANVVAYNYVDDTMYDGFSQIGDYWVDTSVNGSHWTGTHQFLFEGNWGDQLDDDSTHGNEVYHTYFRNWGTGLRTDFTDPSMAGMGQNVSDFSGTGNACFGGSLSNCISEPPNPLHVIGPMQHDYWNAYVGNVLGTASKTTSGNGWNYSGDFTSNKHIWMPGWNTDSTNPSKSDPNLTGSTGNFQFRHGNYDYVNGSIQDWTSGYSHALPNSFYLSQAPSFFGPGASCTYTWPWVTPETGTQLHSNSCSGSGLPAKARYDAGTPFVQP